MIGGNLVNRAVGGAKDAFNTVNSATKDTVDAALDNEKFSVQETVQAGMTEAYQAGSGNEDATAEDVAESFQETAQGAAETWEDVTPDADSGGLSGAAGGALEAGEFLGDALIAEPADAVFEGVTGVDVETGSTEAEVGAVDVADVGLTLGTAGAGKAGASVLRNADEGGRLLSRVSDMAGLSDEAASGSDEALAVSDDLGSVSDDVADLATGSDDAVTAVDDAGQTLDVARVGVPDETADLFNVGRTADELGSAADDVGSVADDAGSTADDLPALTDDVSSAGDDLPSVADDVGSASDDSMGALRSRLRSGADDAGTAGRSADDAVGAADDVGATAGRAADDVGAATDDVIEVTARAGDDAASAGRATDDLAGATDDIAAGADDAASGSRLRNFLGRTSVKVGGGLLAGGAIVGGLSDADDPRDAPADVETESGHSLSQTKDYEPTDRFPNGGRLYSVRRGGQNLGYWLLLGVKGRNLIVLDENGEPRQAKISADQFKQMMSGGNA